MILQALHELYSRLEADASYGLAPPGMSPQKITFCVVLNRDGSLFEIQSVESDRRILVLGDAKPSGSGINPCLLWDNQTYLLGRQPEDKKEGFGLERFEAFRKRHLELETEIADDGFSLVCRFLQHWDPSQIPEHPVLEQALTGFGVFQLIGEKGYVHDRPAIRQWWQKNQPTSDASTLGQCLISGEVGVPIARLHPKIKGVTGAQSAGASIVSFNDSAYESYNKAQSFNSPVSEEAAFRYGAALNALLTGPKARKHRMRIGDTTCVYWTAQRSAFEDAFADILGSGSNAVEQAQDETQRAFLERFFKALRSGSAFSDDQAPVDTPFYFLGLAPNAARLSVRFFFRSTIAELLAHLRSHQRCLRIVREFEETKGKRMPDPEFPALWQLLAQTARVSDEIPPLLGGALTRAIVEGTSYPEGLYSAVLRRIRADREVTYLRASLLKAILVRNHSTPLSTMLDTSPDTPAPYRLGRLFAVLEKIQEEGHFEQTSSRLEKTIRERYFASASATPAAVMPRLEQLSTHHRRHLKAGRKVFFDQLIGEIKWSDAPGAAIKRTQNLEEQGLFILGYYHQRKDLFTKKETAETAPATV
jgi:CRISPR-associated protein Csd1